MKTYARPAAALLCLALGACSDSALSVVCPGVMRPSLLVNVLDSISGQSAAAQARGWWTSGTRTDSLRHVPPTTGEGAVLLAAYGPPGLYDVRVEVAGRPDWIANGIVVTEGSCGPDARDLVAQFTVSP
ncbi:MAG TPA: hypothetical protein VF142_22260 [Longimicrobium sp.]